tara:strand:+ start:901 stop:1056 length:156 start_codon:yes stop_codon:yes gene_type:complete
MDKEELIAHCKLSIKVCSDKILIEGENGNDFWKKFKAVWEERLIEAEAESN